MKGNKQWLNAIPFNLINTFRFSSDHAIFRNMKTIFNLSFLCDITGEEGGRRGGQIVKEDNYIVFSDD